MEVASPLTFGSAGAKRHYPGSPGFVDTNHPFAMIDSAAEEYVPQRAFKRRRFLADECMDESENTQNHSSFPVNSIIPRSSFSSSPFQAAPSFKRCRAEAHFPLQNDDLQKVVDSQAAEMEQLKNDKADLENSFNALKGEHDRVVNENRMLKKAVLIQQERQGQAASELNAARQFKTEAEDRIKKLEQLVFSLRYHLQAQQNNTPGNDFMGFPPRPPDVY